MHTHSRRTRSAGTVAVKRGLAQMLKGGVIMDVVSAEQAKIAEVSVCVSACVCV